MPVTSFRAQTSQSWLSPGRQPPPGCGFPKELAAEANTYPTQAFTREPDSIRQQFLEEANCKILGAGWTREKSEHVVLWQIPKGRVLWLTTSTRPGTTIDEPCLHSFLRSKPPSSFSDLKFWPLSSAHRFLIALIAWPEPPAQEQTNPPAPFDHDSLARWAGGCQKIGQRGHGSNLCVSSAGLILTSQPARGSP